MTFPMIEHAGKSVHRTNSEGNLIHSTDEGIKKFHDWFKDSHVVDEHGRPKVFYHGSVNKNITELNPNIAPVRPRTGPAGVYFTSSKEAAYNYAKHPVKIGEKPNKERGSINAVYLSFKNPLDITPDVKKHQKNGLSFSAAKAAAMEKLTDEHDSVIFHGNNLNSNEFIARHSAQIKSVNNNGEFSPKTNKINETFIEYRKRIKG